jgi:hypothetical protein
MCLAPSSARAHDLGLQNQAIWEEEGPAVRPGGCSQKPGVDFDQTFCATMRSSTLRLLCAISIRWGLRMRRWDFVAAYLQGDLEDGEVVYCSLSPGYENRVDNGNSVPNLGADGLHRVLRIEKPVYGMSQAGRRWQRMLFPWLLAQGFTQHDADPCVFSILRNTTCPDGERAEKLIIGGYVDDLFAATTSVLSIILSSSPCNQHGR